MLQRILMPTDGSPESQKPLAMASQLARAQDAELTLVTVIEEPTFTGTDETFILPADAYQEVVDAMLQGAQTNLGKLQDRLRAENVRVSTVILKGHSAAALLDYVEQERPDLVVMATHGRTGLERFALGSVTDRMVREGKAPVLVTRMSTEPHNSLDRALVMLDGSGLAEEVLPLVEALAGQPFKHITLFRTVSSPADQEVAASYLRGVQGRLELRGLPIEIQVEVGDPRPNVERAAKDADVVVVCTRGEGGFDRLRHGSVAEHVMRECSTPALMVRAETAPHRGTTVP